jgi:phage FluMu protein Com
MSHSFQPNLLAQQDQTFVEIKPCPSCSSTQAIQTPGVSSHYAGLRCANCDRFIKWLPRSKAGEP